MGLDMYLYGIPKKVKIESSEDFFKYSDYMYGHDQDEDESNYCKCLSEWRKAYAIDNWITQHGEELGECVCRVTAEQIVQLITDCAKALLNSKTREEFLKRYQTDYSPLDLDWIKYQLTHTIRDLGDALERADEDTQFIYYASW